MIFSGGMRPGAKRTVELPAGSFFGLYLVQNASTRQLLARNRANRLGGGPVAFFSFKGANPDGFGHLRWLADGQFAFEDQTRGGDRDFNDLVGRFRFRPPRSEPEADAPVITARLANDTARGGTTNADGVTSDPSVAGSVADASRITRFRAGFDGTPVERFVDVLGDLGADGRFTFSRARLNQINGGPLADGPHTLRLQAADEHGNVSAVFALPFTLDTAPPPITFDLAPASDSPPAGDQRTNLATVTLSGQTEANVLLTLQPGGVTTNSTSSGGFSFAGVSLTAGPHVFTVRGSDVAGNEGAATRTIVREVGDVPCGFEEGLAGWSVGERGGSPEGRGTVTAGTMRATLREGNSFDVTLARSIVVPANPGVLTFRFENLAFDPADPAFINDAFEVALLDAEGRSLVHTIAAGRDAFFNVGEDAPAATGTGTTVSGPDVRVDISALTPGSTATLVFRLVNNDSDTATAVDITCVQLESGGVPQAAFAPVPPTKFFVADAQADTTFRYGATGGAAGSFTLDSASPTCAAWRATRRATRSG
jgi:hypothetical protein